MQDQPPPKRRPRRRGRGGGAGAGQRPVRPDARPLPPPGSPRAQAQRGAPPQRGPQRGTERGTQRGPQPPRTGDPQRSAGPQRAPAPRGRRGERRRPERGPDDLRTGTPCLVLLDCREGEPDRTGTPASFEGFFDFETGEPRRAGAGVARLRLETQPPERVWGFEVWWRVDAERAGLTDLDREGVETSKRLLRGLLRDARRRGLVTR